MFVAVGLSVALMGLKFYAYAITGSSAILSDALESIINVVAAGLALGSVLLSRKPPDESHPYGHGKIEYFSAARTIRAPSNPAEKYSILPCPYG